MRSLAPSCDSRESMKRPRPPIDDADPPPGFVSLAAGAGFAAANGPWFERIADGRAVRGFRAAPRHANALGLVHGGMLAAFLDAAMGAAAWRATGRRCVTVRLVTDYLTHGRIGDWIEADAEVAGFDDSVAHVVGRLYGRRHPILAGQGTFALLRPGRRLRIEDAAPPDRSQD